MVKLFDCGVDVSGDFWMLGGSVEVGRPFTEEGLIENCSVNMSPVINVVWGLASVTEVAAAVGLGIIIEPIKLTQR